MRIALTSSCYYPMGVGGASGVPTFVHLLETELVKRGHQVDIFTVGTSHTSGNKIAFFPRGSMEEGLPPDLLEMRELSSSIRTLHYLREHQSDYDIVHNNQWNLFALLELTKLPHTVTTFHNPINEPRITEALAIDPELVHRNFVAIADHQKKSPINFLSRIYNGINLADFGYNEDPSDYAAWLGRITPTKGIKETIAVCSELAIPLRFAGMRSPHEAKFFEEVLEHSKAENGIEFLGEADKQQRSLLLRDARFFLFPIQWDEPFGFVMVEAMACGTPVIAYDRGAAREIVEDGVTGFIVPANDEQALKHAVQNLMNMPTSDYLAMRRACRARVESLFTIEKMVDSYENIYNRLS